MFPARRALDPSPCNIQLDHKIVFMPLLIEPNRQRNAKRTVSWQCVGTKQPLILNPRSGYKFHAAFFTWPEERQCRFSNTKVQHLQQKTAHLSKRFLVESFVVCDEVILCETVFVDGIKEAMPLRNYFKLCKVLVNCMWGLGFWLWLFRPFGHDLQLDTLKESWLYSYLSANQLQKRIRPSIITENVFI
jgi:hypothetical protein